MTEIGTQLVYIHVWHLHGSISGLFQSIFDQRSVVFDW